LSFPAYIVAESDLPSFTKTLLGVENYKLPENQDDDSFEIVRNRNSLKVAISRSIDFKEYFLIKWRFKVRLFSSSKELKELLQKSFSNSNAVPIESFEG